MVDRRVGRFGFGRPRRTQQQQVVQQPQAPRQPTQEERAEQQRQELQVQIDTISDNITTRRNELNALINDPNTSSSKIEDARDSFRTFLDSQTARLESLQHAQSQVTGEFTTASVVGVAEQQADIQTQRAEEGETLRATGRRPDGTLDPNFTNFTVDFSGAGQPASTFSTGTPGVHGTLTPVTDADLQTTQASPSDFITPTSESEILFGIPSDIKRGALSFKERGLNLAARTGDFIQGTKTAEERRINKLLAEKTRAFNKDFPPFISKPLIEGSPRAESAQRRIQDIEDLRQKSEQLALERETSAHTLSLPGLPGSTVDISNIGDFAKGLNDAILGESNSISAAASSGHVGLAEKIISITKQAESPAGFEADLSKAGIKGGLTEAQILKGVERGSKIITFIGTSPVTLPAAAIIATDPRQDLGTRVEAGLFAGGTGALVGGLKTVKFLKTPVVVKGKVPTATITADQTSLGLIKVTDDVTADLFKFNIVAERGVQKAVVISKKDLLLDKVKSAVVGIDTKKLSQFDRNVLAGGKVVEIDKGFKSVVSAAGVNFGKGDSARSFAFAVSQTKRARRGKTTFSVLEGQSTDIGNITKAINKLNKRQQKLLSESIGRGQPLGSGDFLLTKGGLAPLSSRISLGSLVEKKVGKVSATGKLEPIKVGKTTTQGELLTISNRVLKLEDDKITAELIRSNIAGADITFPKVPRRRKLPTIKEKEIKLDLNELDFIDITKAGKLKEGRVLKAKDILKEIQFKTKELGLTTKRGRISSRKISKAERKGILKDVDIEVLDSIVDLNIGRTEGIFFPRAFGKGTFGVKGGDIIIGRKFKGRGRKDFLQGKGFKEFTKRQQDAIKRHEQVHSIDDVFEISGNVDEFLSFNFPKRNIFKRRRQRKISKRIQKFGRRVDLSTPKGQEFSELLAEGIGRRKTRFKQFERALKDPFIEQPLKSKSIGVLKDTTKVFRTKKLIDIGGSGGSLKGIRIQQFKPFQSTVSQKQLQTRVQDKLIKVAKKPAKISRRSILTKGGFKDPSFNIGLPSLATTTTTTQSIKPLITTKTQPVIKLDVSTKPLLTTKLQPKLLPKLTTKLTSKLQPKLLPKLQPKLQPKLTTKLSTKLQPKLTTKLTPKITTKLVPPPKVPTSKIKPFPVLIPLPKLKGKKRKKKRRDRFLKGDKLIVEGFTARTLKLKPIKIPKSKLPRVRQSPIGIRRRVIPI